MTPQLFLSRDGTLLPNWQAAFPQAQSRSLSADRAAAMPDDSLIWVDISGPQEVQTVLQSQPHARVIALSRHPLPAEGLACLRLGCRGYCHTLATPDMLEDVAQVVVHGGVWAGADLLQQGLRSLRSPLPAENQVWELLTPRERQIAGCIIDGLNNKEICRHLGIEERTTKTHITAILKKAQVRDRLQLVARLTHHPASTAAHPS